MIIGGCYLCVLLICSALIFSFLRNKSMHEAIEIVHAKLVSAESLFESAFSMKRSFKDSGLSFGAFETRLDRCYGDKFRARPWFYRDPHKGKQMMTDVESAVRLLVRDMQLALELSVGEFWRAEHTFVKSRIAAQREQDVDWSFPGISADTLPRQKFLLNERYHVPDRYLDSAVMQVSLVQLALHKGEFAEVEKYYAAYRQTCQFALECLARTLHAKLRVETELSSLLQASKEDDAASVQSIKDAYFGQQFVLARELMDRLTLIMRERERPRKAT
ncbi:MAG: hypothetical protein K2W95_33580 [Candidatus Obscuribacterales bacterium]|nr:hypothetical protein [Candidatus Obscuribacterales bacterium]